MYEIVVRSGRNMEMIDITSQVNRVIRESGIWEGSAVVFVPHTTAGLTVNENADPSVVRDLLRGFSALSPSRPDYEHREGNSPAHLLSTLVGVEKTFLIEEGRLCLGTWQGIYFCEFDGPRERRVWVGVNGRSASV